MAVRSWRHRAPGSVVREYHHTRSEHSYELIDRVADLERRVDALEHLPEPAVFLPPDPVREEDLPPPPEIPPEPVLEPAVAGDWREAIKRMEGNPDGPEDDFGIGMEIEPEPILEGVPFEESVTVTFTDPIPDIEDEASMAEQRVLEPPPVSKTLVISQEKTITDFTALKSQIAYETAIQAKNGSIRARGLLMEPAARRGLSIEDLVEEIMTERDATVQRIMSEF